METLDGEARAARVGSDLLDARLIAARVAERSGRPPRSHRLFEEPGRVCFPDGGRPAFLYLRPTVAYSVAGPEHDRLLLETRLAGSVEISRTFSVGGALLEERRLAHGCPERN